MEKTFNLSNDFNYNDDDLSFFDELGKRIEFCNNENNFKDREKNDDDTMCQKLNKKLENEDIKDDISFDDIESHKYTTYDMDDIDDYETYEDDVVDETEYIGCTNENENLVENDDFLNELCTQDDNVFNLKVSYYHNHYVTNPIIRTFKDFIEDIKSPNSTVYLSNIEFINKKVNGRIVSDDIINEIKDKGLTYKDIINRVREITRNEYNKIYDKFKSYLKEKSLYNDEYNLEIERLKVDLYSSISANLYEIYKEFILNMKNEIDEIRSEYKKQRTIYKNLLSAYTITGEFTKRKADYLEMPNGLCIIDLDGIEPIEIKPMFENIIKMNKYILCGFISPSGNGIKLVIRIPNERKEGELMKDYLKRYKDDYIDYLIGFKENHPELAKYIDCSGKDVSRLCYISYDEDIYINENAEIWDKKCKKNENDISLYEFSKKYESELKNIGYTYKKGSYTDSYDFLEIGDLSKKFSVIRKIIERMNFTGGQLRYVVGQRNNYIYVFSCKCCEAGIPISDTINYVFTEIDNTIILDDARHREILSTIKSAYNGENKFRFGTFKLLDYEAINYINNTIKSYKDKNEIIFLNVYDNDDKINDLINRIQEDLLKIYKITIDVEKIKDIIHNEININNLELNILQNIRIIRPKGSIGYEYVFEINLPRFIRFIEDLLGIRKVYINKANNVVVIVAIRGKRITQVDDKSLTKIKDIVSLYFNGMKKHCGIEYIDGVPIDIFMDKLSRDNDIFGKSGLSRIRVLEIKNKLLRSTATKTYLYFSDGVIEVQKISKHNNVKIIPDEKLDKYIWDDSYELDLNEDNVERFCTFKFKNIDCLVKKPYDETVSYSYYFKLFEYEPELYKESVINKFFEKCSDDDVETDIKRISFGYLASEYKSHKKSETFAVYFVDKPYIEDLIYLDRNNEYKENGEDSSGGRGKSFIEQCLKPIRNVSKIDGKGDLSQRFITANVSIFCDVVHIDDFNPTPDNITRIYNWILGDFTIEDKYKSPITLKFKESPKIFITSNTLLKKNDPSTNRRFKEVYFNNYFQDKDVSLDLGFKGELFTDFTEKDWIEYFHFVIHCISLWLDEKYRKLLNKVSIRSKIYGCTYKTFHRFLESEKGLERIMKYKENTKSKIDDYKQYISQNIIENKKENKTLYFVDSNDYISLNESPKHFKYICIYNEYNNCIEIYKHIKFHFFSDDVLYNKYIEFCIQDLSIKDIKIINQLTNFYGDKIYSKDKFFQKLEEYFNIISKSQNYFKLNIGENVNYINKVYPTYEVQNDDFLNKLNEIYRLRSNEDTFSKEIIYEYLSEIFNKGKFLFINEDLIRLFDDLIEKYNKDRRLKKSLNKYRPTVKELNYTVYVGYIKLDNEYNMNKKYEKILKYDLPDCKNLVYKMIKDIKKKKNI